MGRVELRETLRESESNQSLIDKIYQAVAAKPERHEFVISQHQTQGIARHMSELGG